MAPREPTRAQMSSKLGYQSSVPPFLQKLKNRMAGLPDPDDDEAPQYDDDEFEHVGEGRAPIPRRPRPAIPERPSDDPGSADEEDEFPDEKPQVVVLKEGKHLTEWEAENVRRAEKGLPPLPAPGSSKGGRDVDVDADAGSTEKDAAKKEKKEKEGQQGLSFSSSKGSSSNANSKKRKAIGQLDELKAKIDAADKSKSKGGKSSSKKPKKESKTLLSFGDDT
ncbi:hypothetical protein D9619_004776 [Psilocybe cf. subviscida]|uniref:DUF4604 domain-containing protein n=1 Tax=Psilocybe cf. subviscida TaxID=2480587 RepID=A0A8H5BQQ9_9AGAR|nr:hypothetical protein D9619_004776 [Psilocybe cf. subviscida]